MRTSRRAITSAAGNRPRRKLLAAGACVAGALTAAACGTSPKTAAPTTTATPGTTVPDTTTSTIKRGSGSVEVLYAGSLVTLITKQVGPGFQSATGYTLNGFSAGSTALATDIKGKVYAADVFISASPAVNATLEGAANGNWVSWYATFATSPLVIGYNPHSSFATDLQTKPWWQVITGPGILIGRTDPATDPKGKLTVEALQDAATADSAPALNTLATNSSTVFPEETLVGRLQAGQLDAGFFYASEAKAAGIPTVGLTGLDLKATYTITVLDNAPNPAGATAFVEYLLGPAGLADLTADGFTLVNPVTVSGTGVPSSLQSLLGS